MAQIAAYEDIKHRRKERVTPRGYTWNTPFFVPPEGEIKGPHAYLAEGTAGRIIRPHYHNVDEFQVVTSGGGLLGKHPLAVHAVHFVRAYTPYAVTAGDQGLGFLTLRPARHSGAKFLPQTRAELDSVPNRQPWQISEPSKFNHSADVSIHPFSRIKDKCGLAAFSLVLKPGAKSSAPDPSTSNGQYIVILKGGLSYSGTDHEAIILIFLTPDEQPFELAAGAEGLEAVILNFPRSAAPLPTVRTIANAPGSRVWQCRLCDFIYDESKGLPDEGVLPGTRWEDVPEEWSCPDCTASKADFQMALAVR